MEKDGNFVGWRSGEKEMKSVVLIVVHVANVPVEAVFALYLVGTHRTRELRFNTTLVTLVLNQGTTSRVTASTARTNVWLILNQCRCAWRTSRATASC